MASPLDDFDVRRIRDTDRNVRSLLEQIAVLQTQIGRFVKINQNSNSFGRKYLRRLLQQKREENAQLKLYIVQLENELRLRGLE